MSKHKQCPHINTVMAGGDNEIRTYCTDCNELIRTIHHNNGKHLLTINSEVDSHGDVIMPGSFNIPNEQRMW